MTYDKYFENGQILLLVVLAMVVSLTIGLSVATTSLTNLHTSTEEVNSERALSAAEAGAEQVIKSNTSTAGTFANNSSYATSVNPVAGAELLLNNGTIVNKDEGFDIWLSTYPTYLNPWSGNLTIYWGSSSDVCSLDPATNTETAIEVVLLSGDKASPTVSHFAVDPCGARRAANNFSSVSGGNTIGGIAFENSTTIPVNSGLLARVIPLYSGTVMAVKGDSFLPSQGQVISSTGTSGDTVRQLKVYKGYPQLPTEFFPFSLFVAKSS